MPAEETRKEVKFVLRLYEVSGKYQGEIKMIPEIRTGLTLQDVTVGGDKLWATVDVTNGFPIELRLQMRGNTVTGRWINGYENNGTLKGTFYSARSPLANLLLPGEKERRSEQP